MLFDGRKFAKDREILLRDKVESLSRKPVLVSVLVGENQASELYTKMKEGAAERAGIEFEVVKIEVPVGLAHHISPDVTEDDKLALSKFSEFVKNRVSGIGARDEVDGVMVQLPLPVSLDKDTAGILTAIEIEKDVDGLRWQESGIMPATVRAVLSVLDSIKKGYEIADLWERKFVLVGYTGNVGAPLTSFLQKRGVEIEGINSKTENVNEILHKADVVISCVGKPGLVKADNVSEGVIVVDVGIDMIDGKPRGDMDVGVYRKASVAVPVPGGVGPVTVVSLLENLVDLV